MVRREHVQSMALPICSRAFPLVAVLFAPCLDDSEVINPPTHMSFPVNQENNAWYLKVGICMLWC